ncbi:hypothetical protein MASR2M79_12810 [Aminivibrio sp.]
MPRRERLSIRADCGRRRKLVPNPSEKETVSRALSGWSSRTPAAAWENVDIEGPLRLFQAFKKGRAAEGIAEADAR